MWPQSPSRTNLGLSFPKCKMGRYYLPHRVDVRIKCLERTWNILSTRSTTPVVFFFPGPTHTLRRPPDQMQSHALTRTVCPCTRILYTPLVLSVLYSGLASNGNSCYLRSCSAILPSSPSACSPQDFIHRTLEGWLSSHQQPPPPCQTSHIPIHPDVILTSVPGGIPSSSASLGSLSSLSALVFHDPL